MAAFKTLLTTRLVLRVTAIRPNAAIRVLPALIGMNG